jgi:hypothetical protein
MSGKKMYTEQYTLDYKYHLEYMNSQLQLQRYMIQCTALLLL